MIDSPKEMKLISLFPLQLLWIILLSMMIYLRLIQKRRQNRELAESMEDARIFAASREVMDPHNMQMQMRPIDQVSVVSSHQSSSMLSQKPSIISANPSGASSSQQQQLGSGGYPAPTPQQLQQGPNSIEPQHTFHCLYLSIQLETA